MSRRKKPRYVPFTGAPIDEKPTPPKEKDKKVEKKKEKVKKVEKVKEKDKKVEKKKEKKVVEKKKAKGEKIVDTSHDINTFTWQMEKFQIMLADGQNVMVAVMLEAEPSEPIKEALIEFTKQFEAQFKDKIVNFQGRVSDFASAREMADKTFNLFLMQPQMFPYDDSILENCKTTSIESRVCSTAKELADERGFFFIATLMEEINKRRKMDQEKLVKAIFSLHGQGIFKSIPIEKISEESEKHLMMKRLPENLKLNVDQKMKVMDELVNSTEESREHFFSVLPNLPKKNPVAQILREIEKRQNIRENRDQLFAKLDEYVNNDQIENAVMILNQVANLSLQIGERSVADVFNERAESFRQAAEQMRNQIPMMRNQRNQLLNQAESLEVEGRYDEAISAYSQAAEVSSQISDFEMQKRCLDAVERLKSLKELASLRESLR